MEKQITLFSQRTMAMERDSNWKKNKKTPIKTLSSASLKSLANASENDGASDVLTEARTSLR